MRKKNIQQDIEYLFYQSNVAWYYLIKIALMFRKKLGNQNTSGYHIFPPINCQQIFKLSLRKSYQLVEQFLTQQNIPISQTLQQNIDHYAINQISKYKQNDEQFQKQSLQQIHILREINFDIIAGFCLDSIASQKSIKIQGLLRNIHLKQQQMNTAIGYGEFEVIYRKYYKEKRSKIQLIYSKVCLCNLSDILNVQNMSPAIRLMIQDQLPLRTFFDKNQTLKAIIHNEKNNLSSLAKNQKFYQRKIIPILTTNTFQQFRQRFYQQFYDFYDMSILLDQIFKIFKTLAKKKLKKIKKDQKYIQTILAQQNYKIIGEQNKQQHQKKDQQNQQQQSNSQQQEQDEENQSQSKQNLKDKLQKQSQEKSYLEQKLQQWNKIQLRIPHFTSKVLTIDQIIVHNMRRKQMFDGCQFAWRTLREIMTAVTK